MKFTGERDLLVKEISIAQEIIASRNQLSILSNVFLHADDQRLLIRASDLKVSFRTSIPVDVISPGTTTVFCDKLLAILRTLPEGLVTFSLNDDGVFVISPAAGKTKINFKLKCIAADKFPELTTADDDQYFDVPQADFVEMVSQTVFAVSDDETRYFMNGVYLDRSDTNLIMVATDGRRLSFISKPTNQGIPDFPGIIIPPKVLYLIKKLVPGEGQISIAIGDKAVYFKFGHQFLSSALIEGQFPNYQRVIPDSQTHQFTVKRTELIEALKRVSLLVEKSRRVYVNLSDQVFTLASEETDVGAAHEDIPCTYSGNEVQMAVNYVYLFDPIRTMDCEDVLFEFTEPNRAITIKPDSSSDFFHIVMPMQLD